MNVHKDLVQINRHSDYGQRHQISLGQTSSKPRILQPSLPSLNNVTHGSRKRRPESEVDSGFCVSKRAREDLPCSSSKTATIGKLVLGEKKLTCIQWSGDDRLYLILSEVIQELFKDRARSSVLLRLNNLDTPNTLVRSADYAFRFQLKSLDLIKTNTNMVRFIEFQDLLRLKVSLQIQPKLKTGCSKVMCPAPHLDEIHWKVQTLISGTATLFDKLRVLHKVFQ